MYEYKCDNCGFTVERQHPMSVQPEYKCPHCLQPLRKKFTTPALSSAAITTRKIQMIEEIKQRKIKEYAVKKSKCLKKSEAL